MPTVSIFDRFNTLLSVGRTIAAAPTAAALNDAIRQAALALLHGERCHVVNMSELPEEDSVTESGEWIDAVSRTLLDRAVEERVPVVTDDPLVDGSESLILSGIRSVLAAPIVVDDEVSHCFYVTHRQIGHLFGEDEIQLASFIATLAGAAAEHLAGTEARFRSIGQNSSDVLTLVDSTGTIVYQSSAAARLFELPAPGLVGLPVLDWVHPEDGEVFGAALDRATREAQARVECRLRHADGTFLHAETAVTNLLDDPAVGAFVLNTHDVTERRRLEDELRDLALSDQLTGLPNRVHFLERTRAALAREGGPPLVLCFVDLDDFKAVNDAHGHGAGDQLLKSIAVRLTEGLRPKDTVARFGGDEFALLLENTDLPSAVRIVERLLESVSAPVDIGGDRGGHARQHRTRRLGGAPVQTGRRACRGRRSHVRRQGRRRQPVQRLPSEHAGGGGVSLAGSRRRRRRTAPRGVPVALPADHRPAVRGARRGRGTDPVAAPRAGSALPRALHRPCRGERPDRADRRLGVGRGLPRHRRSSRRRRTPASTSRRVSCGCRC